jgi:hypothetical protein
MSKSALFCIIGFSGLALACRLGVPTATPVPTMTAMPIPFTLTSTFTSTILASTPTRTVTPTTVITSQTATTGGPCVLVADGDVTIYARPAPSAQVFSSIGAGFSVQITGKTADGWLGFDPGVAQAANMGSFRLRWVDPGSAIHLQGACQAVPVVWGPPPGICFTMPMEATAVYTSADTSTAIITTLAPGDFAAVLGQTGSGWSKVDLGPGNTGLSGIGWVEDSSLNLNGPCDPIPQVTP